MCRVLCERLLISLAVVGHHTKQSSSLSQFSRFCHSPAIFNRRVAVFPSASSLVSSSSVRCGDASLFHRGGAPRRNYSDDRNDHNDVQTISGYIMHLPNPITWLKTKLYDRALRAVVEPSFNLPEFIIGSKQAISYLTRLAATSNYTEMRRITSDQVVREMQETLLTWPLEQQCAIELTPDDMSVVRPDITRIARQKHSYLVDIDVLCLALKNDDDGSLLVELLVRFSRTYGQESSGEWQITHVNHLSVKEFGGPPKDE